METAKQFTTSPATGGLLLAMRHLESAQDSFYSALQAICSEASAEQGLSEFHALYKPLREFIEAQILDNIRDWAASPEIPAEI